MKWPRKFADLNTALLQPVCAVFANDALAPLSSRRREIIQRAIQIVVEIFVAAGWKRAGTTVQPNLSKGLTKYVRQ